MAQSPEHAPDLLSVGLVPSHDKEQSALLRASIAVVAAMSAGAALALLWQIASFAPLEDITLTASTTVLLAACAVAAARLLDRHVRAAGLTTVVGVMLAITMTILAFPGHALLLFPAYLIPSLLAEIFLASGAGAQVAMVALILFGVMSYILGVSPAPLRRLPPLVEAEQAAFVITGLLYAVVSLIVWYYVRSQRRAWEMAQQRSRDIDMLRRFGLDLAELVEPDVLLPLAARRAAQLSSQSGEAARAHDACWIWLASPEEGTLHLAAAHPGNLHSSVVRILERIRFPRGVGPIGRVALTGRTEVMHGDVFPLLIEATLPSDMGSDLATALPVHVASLVVAPLRSPAGLLGCLVIAREPGHPHLGERDVQVLEAFAAQVGTLLHTAHLYADLQRTADSLERERGFIRSVTDAMAEGVVVFDDRGRHAYVNPAFCRMTGYSGDELLGRDPPAPYWESHVHHTLLEQALSPSQQRPQWLDIPIQRKTGGSLPARVSATALHSASGSLTGLVAVIRDATAEREVEDAARYRALLLDNASDAILSVDLEGTIRSWNRAAERIYGWMAQEAIGQRLDALLATQASVPWEEFWAITLRDGQWRGDVRQRHRQGHWLEIETTMALLRGGDAPLGLVIVNRDVTAHRQLERDLARAVAYATGIIDSSQDIVYTVDREYCLRQVNRSWQAYAEACQAPHLANPSNVVGRHLLDAISDPSLRDFYRRIMDEILAGQRTSYTHEMTFDTAHGPQTWQLTISPWQVEGRVEGLVFVSHDITALVKAQAETRRLYEELHRAYLQTVRALVGALDVREAYSAGHGERLSALAERLAQAMGCSDAQCEAIRWGALLHDIGKLGVPEAILRKPGPLTDDEWAIMHQHPDIGAHILEQVPWLAPAVPIVRYHQERWDGTGYPHGLAGHTIPLEARILAVADAFAAMTDERLYRQALSPEQALEELRKGAGSQFDPQVVEALIQLVSTSPA